MKVTTFFSGRRAVLTAESVLTQECHICVDDLVDNFEHLSLSRSFAAIDDFPWVPAAEQPIGSIMYFHRNFYTTKSHTFTDWVRRFVPIEIDNPDPHYKMWHDLATAGLCIAAPPGIDLEPYFKLPNYERKDKAPRLFIERYYEQNTDHKVQIQRIAEGNLPFLFSIEPPYQVRTKKLLYHNGEEIEEAQKILDDCLAFLLSPTQLDEDPKDCIVTYLGEQDSNLLERAKNALLVKLENEKTPAGQHRWYLNDLLEIFESQKIA